MDDQSLEWIRRGAAAPLDITRHPESKSDDFFLLQLQPLIPNNPCLPIPIKILEYRSLSASPIYWRG
jgi:hypothetical protein